MDQMTHLDVAFECIGQGYSKDQTVHSRPRFFRVRREQRDQERKQWKLATYESWMKLINHIFRTYRIT